MATLPKSPCTIACFGEALWDVLPRGIFLGGAPMNVAYHLSRQGVRSLPVSAVGADFLGDEALRRISGWGLALGGIRRIPSRATGTVQAEIDRSGVAHYRIARHVAWDRIASPRRSLGHRQPAALVFGTLALREAPNRRTLARLCARWPRALRVLDLNLRTPFDGAPVIATALKSAQLVKLNDEELARLIRGTRRTPAALGRAAGRFAARHGLSRVCVTAGALGAGLWWHGHWHWCRGRKVVVRDTVGAGDAFLGTLLVSLLARHLPPAQALERACRVGEFVAGRDGATPPYHCDRHGRPVAD